MSYEAPIATRKLVPQEEMLELRKTKKELTIGIPREKNPHEYRIGLTPLGVQSLVQAGHKVVIESDAGKGANYTDLEYSEAGATVTKDITEVYRCEIILKVAPLTLEEIELLHGRQIVFSAFHIATQNVEVVRALMRKKITAVGFEFMQDEHGLPPVVRSMSEITGSASILIAAQYLSTIHGGKGVLLGGVAGISPTEVMILGAGTTGEYAARAALGLGATVKVFDSSVHLLRELQKRLGQSVFTSVLQPLVLEKNLRSADVVIGAMSRYTAHHFPQPYITEEMVMKMKRGSVIIDISVDNGACFETSRITDFGSPVFRKYGIVHFCVPNLASSFSRTASIGLSNIFTPILQHIGDMGGITQLLRNEHYARKGVYIYNGILTSSYIGGVFELQWQDIDLLMAAF